LFVVAGRGYIQLAIVMGNVGTGQDNISEVGLFFDWLAKNVGSFSHSVCAAVGI
jgi:hypothetical protein